MHNGARYAVMHKVKLTDTLTHIDAVGEYDSYEEAVERAEPYLNQHD